MNPETTPENPLPSTVPDAPAEPVWYASDEHFYQARKDKFEQAAVRAVRSRARVHRLKAELREAERDAAQDAGLFNVAEAEFLNAEVQRRPSP